MIDAKLGVMDTFRWDVDFTFAMEGIDFDEHGGLCALETNTGEKRQLSRFPPALAYAQWTNRSGAQRLQKLKFCPLFV